MPRLCMLGQGTINHWFLGGGGGGGGGESDIFQYITTILDIQLSLEVRGRRNQPRVEGGGGASLMLHYPPPPPK